MQHLGGYLGKKQVPCSVRVIFVLLGFAALILAATCAYNVSTASSLPEVIGWTVAGCLLVAFAIASQITNRTGGK